MKAIPTIFNISVNYSCEKCSNIFTLTDFDVPTSKSIQYNCKVCSASLEIEPLNIIVEEKPLTDNRPHVKKVLKNYGYSPDEIEQMIGDIDDYSQEPSVLLKIALASKD